jgi:hypothetical protein
MGKQNTRRDKPRHVCNAERGDLHLSFGAEPGNGRVQVPDAEPVVVVVSSVSENIIMVICRWPKGLDLQSLSIVMVDWTRTFGKKGSHLR